MSYPEPLCATSSTSELVLEVSGLVKQYGKFRAVDGISFSVPRGKVVGLLGPNGAGKTTTIHMLVGTTQSDGGTIRYFGQDFQRYRQACLQRINFTSSFNTLQGRISVWENLVVFAHLYGLSKAQQKIRDLVEYFEITDLLDQRFITLSAGQKTRVNLVKSLLNDPEIILMDEPTASLDPDIADRTLSLIESLRHSRGLSILYTSHEMDEVTRICDEVVFLDHGSIVAQDTPQGLTRRIPTTRLHLSFQGDAAVVADVMNRGAHDASFPGEQTVVVTLPEADVPKVIFEVRDAGVRITDIEVHKPTLEDVFMQIARGSKHVA